MSKLLERIEKCDGISLDLSGLGLETFPEEVFSFKETLELLNLGGNRLKELPDSLESLQRLKILFLIKI